MNLLKEFRWPEDMKRTRMKQLFLRRRAQGKPVPSAEQIDQANLGLESMPRFRTAVVKTQRSIREKQSI